MKEGFRQAIAWLHTWVGLTFGWLLFAIFLTGTLSYFKDEISQWTHPETAASEMSSASSIERAQHWLQDNARDASSWFIKVPDQRSPQLALSWSNPNGTFGEKVLDAQTGAPTQARDSRGGEFFYRFHFQLQMPYPWGRWLASLAAMAMLVALISGIVTHKKIFKEFFTFRPRKGQRTWLDGHNAVAVLVLPFHLMITYSSLVIFMSMTMPASILTAYGNDTQSFYEDLFPTVKNQPAAKQAGVLAPVSMMFEVATEEWRGGRVGLITVNHPGAANASVTLMRSSGDQITYEPGSGMVFDGITGQLQSQNVMTGAPLILAGGLYGMHMGHFAGPLLRWLYFLCGVGGTAMIGTGLVIWLGKRRLKHARSAVLPFELRLVEALNIATMAGLMLAVAGFFWANRVLPVTLEGRGDWEVQTFFAVWGLSLLHSGVRVWMGNGRGAWREQLTLAALLYCVLPLLDMLTAGKYLLASLQAGHWVQLGFDLAALMTGVFLAWGAVRFRGDGQKTLASKLPQTAFSPMQIDGDHIIHGREPARDGITAATSLESR